MNIILIDDHPLVRNGVASFLQTNLEGPIIHECANMVETFSVLATHAIDLVILDIGLSNENGFDLMKRMEERHHHIPTLILSMHDDAITINKALMNGAMGFVSKIDEPHEIINAIQFIEKGKTYVSKQSTFNISNKEENELFHSLSKRELEVFILLSEEYSRKDISDKLTISLRTVETHIERIKSKLRIKSGHQLMCLALRYNQFHQQGLTANEPA